MKIRKPYYFFSILFCVIILGGFTLPGERLHRGIESAYNTINPISLYSYCKTLASPRFAGRLTGHQGYTDAAKWAADNFTKWGLKPIDPENGFLQPYPSPYVIIEHASMIIYTDGTTSILKAEEEFLPMLYSDSGKNKATVVFVGWGIDAPELGYSDYTGVDVKGKFVLCFRGTPDPENKAFTEYDQHRHRMNTAKQKGSLGVIYIYEDVGSNPNGDWLEGFTPAEISFPVADKILAEKNITATQLQKDLLASKKPNSFALTKTEIELNVQSKYFPDGIGYNVAGYIEGSDPQLKEECLLIGAHFDHNGTHMGLLFPGADDNASGSAVVMELARTLALTKTPPKRSILFVLFGGEEKGLQGSYYFAEHLPAPFTKVTSMFNFDMVGEGDKTFCMLSQEPAALENTLKWADSFVNTLEGTRYMKNIGVRSSDFAPFYVKGASCISFFSNGPHLNYHKTTENIYRINPDIMADVAKLAFLTAYKWASEK